MRGAWLATTLLAGSLVMGVAVEGRTIQDAGSAADSPEQREKLKGLVEEILRAMKAGENERVSSYFEELAIPNHKEWFETTFGVEEGARLERRYLQLLKEPSGVRRADFIGAVTRDKTHASVTLLRKTEEATRPLDRAVLSAMSQLTPLYVVRATGESGSDSWHIGKFVFIEGAFRYLDDRVLQQLSTAPAMRIRIGGNVRAAQLVTRVQPVYPAEAVAKNLTGTVRMHVVTNVNGAVMLVEVMSGDPILAPAAVEAVKQWKYRPTLLNGVPVEVDSTVDVVFKK
jgi:TonB family protein